MPERIITDEPDRDEALGLITDAELVRAWELSSGEESDPVADAIAAELARRDIDF